MNLSNHRIELESLRDNFKNVCLKFDQLLAEDQQTITKNIRVKIRQELKEYRAKKLPTVVFIGPGNVGKSTIISALTGQRNIINPTKTTTEYLWKELSLIDTPGLCTEFPESNFLIEQTLTKADILVFCLSSHLFDPQTLEIFKKLVSEQQYAWKTILVVNKMSNEDGKESAKINHYRHSLAQSLHPEKIEQFPLCFIDAKDYCNGIDENNLFNCKISRLQTLINTLEQFIPSRRLLIPFDVPVRIALNFVAQSKSIKSHNSTQDLAFLEILTRLSYQLNEQRHHLTIQIEKILAKMLSAISQEILLLLTITPENKNPQTILNSHLKLHCETAEKELQTLLETTIKNLPHHLEEILQNELINTVISSLETSPNQYTETALQGLSQILEIAQTEPQSFPHINSLQTIPLPTFSAIPIENIQLLQTWTNAIEQQLKTSAENWLNQHYEPIDQKIAQVRQQQEQSIVDSSIWLKQIEEVQEDFTKILHYIAQTLTPN